jgi:hypothetical protein
MAKTRQTTARAIGTQRWASSVTGMRRADTMAAPTKKTARRSIS